MPSGHSKQGHRMTDEKLIRLPLTHDHEQALAVWARFGPSLPIPERIVKNYFAWLEGHVDEPLRSSLRAWALERQFEVRVLPVGQVPAPTLEVLRAVGHGSEEERRLKEATHEIVFMARDGGMEPRLALQSVLAAACATGETWSGVILDRDVPRLLPLDSHSRRLSPRVKLADHIRVVSHKDGQGKTCLLARGMHKFQLPMLEVRDVPEGMRQTVTLVMNAMAEILAWRVRRQVQQGSDHLNVPREFLLKLDHDALKRVDLKATTLPGARRATVLGVQHVRSPIVEERVLRLVAPPSPGGPQVARMSSPRGDVPSQGGAGHQEWLKSVAVDLLGAPQEQVARKLEDQLIEEAHQRAMEQVAELKQRYQKGLPKGHRVYVKRAFPTKQGSPEYLWLSVDGWYDGMIRGPLATVPRVRTDLQLGQTLQMQEDDIYDWVVTLPDGTELGAYTDMAVKGRKVYRVL